MTFKLFSFNEAAFIANYALFREATLGACGAVVKGNAYGTGAGRVVPLLDRAGCEHFFVATPKEGIEVRGLTNTKVYVLAGPTDATAAAQMAQNTLIPVLNTRSQLELWKPYRGLPCAIHVDTGMHRLGFAPDTLKVAELFPFEVCLLMTHLACADDPEHSQNEIQVRRFHEVAKLLPNVPTSIGNSAGFLNGESFQGDVVRIGIGLYGGNPFARKENPVQPVCTLEGRVLQIREVPPNEFVGYGASFTSSTPTRIAVVGIGYADGISRALSNNGEVAFRGRRMPMIGKISMDATQIDCTQVPDLKENDFVEFFGSTISVDEVASRINTIAYEILTQVGNATVRD